MPTESANGEIAGARLRRQREACGLSQEELAARSGLSVRAISDLERGRTRRPYPRTVRMLADALGVADGGPAAPQQLPPAVRHFAGREREFDRLCGLLAEAGGASGAVLIAVISGTAGVGKTALALQWAHQVAERFPDGQLYVNLRGYDAGAPLPAGEVLAGFLRALGVNGKEVPPDAATRAAAYRSLLAGRRMLVLLDNANHPEQVRPLLPGSAGCTVLVTSRDTLAGLVARDGAARVELDALPPDASASLLRELIGTRVDEEPAAAATLADRCCRLPLALRVAAELAVARPSVPLGTIVAELADLQHRLDVLDAGGDEVTAVRTAFSWSYRHLDADAARAFRLAALHPGTDFDLYAAAALLDTDASAAGQLLDRLTRAHLILRAGADRYGMHDLLRGYARDQAASVDGAAGCDAAVTRLLDSYLHAAAAAMDTLFPADTGRRPRLAPFRGDLAPVAGAEAARAWLDAERANLIVAAAHATAHGRPHAMGLSATVARYLAFGNHLSEAMALHEHALRAARQLGDRSAAASALSHLGFLQWEWGRSQQAADHQRQALELLDGTGDRVGRYRALHRLALAERRLGDLAAAAEHADHLVALCQHAGDRLGETSARQSLAITRRAQGQFTAATDLNQQVLALLDETGERHNRSAPFQELGAIDLRFGRLDPAERHLTEAIDLCREARNQNGHAEALSQLGLACLGGGRDQEAIEHQHRALALFREAGDRHGEAAVLARLALAEHHTGRTADSLEYLQHALCLAHTLDARLVQTTVLIRLGEVLLATGQAQPAAAHLTAALTLAERTGDRDAQARAHHALAHAQAALADPDRAYGHLRQARTRYAALGVPEADQCHDLSAAPPMPLAVG
jgi:tetratricopeptide (TPR) repeat protein/transcriptional regulator with XRE-family HTH domain